MRVGAALGARNGMWQIVWRHCFGIAWGHVLHAHAFACACLAMGLQDKVERTLAAAAEGDDRAQAKAFGEVSGGMYGRVRLGTRDSVEG